VRPVESAWWRFAPGRVALVLGVWTLLLTVAAVPLSFVSGGQSSGLPIVPFGIVGFLIAWRRPRNPIGWIMLGLAFVFLLASDAGQYAVMDYRQGYHLPLARAAVFLAAWWIWLIVLLPLPVGLFPDARLSRRWRSVLWCYLVVCGCLVATLTVRDIVGIGARRIRIDSTGELVSAGSPSGVAAPLYGVFIAFCLVWIMRQVFGYRSSTGEYRQQLKWLLSGGAICLTALVLTLAGLSFAFVAIIALPIGIGIGILKYRLYEIDRLISRTLSYALLTAALAGVFVAIVVIGTDVLPFSSPVAVAASTLAAAALFNPLRLRIQRLVDRRFNRSRYDGEATVAAFSGRLRDAIDLESIRLELLHAIDETLAPAQVSLWIRPSASAARVSGNT
jgi:hypothetical protein